MAFTVEDGTGVAGANSYVDLVYADEFFADRADAVWAAIATDAEKQALLIQATDYIELRYARSFIGDMAATDQALSWPRINTGDYLDVAYGDTEIPAPLKKACCLYALQAKSGPLMPVPEVDATGFAVVTTRKAVGPIEKEFRVAGGGTRPSTIRSYPMPDAMMTTLLIPGAGRVIR